jgi:hypothetical protein
LKTHKKKSIFSSYAMIIYAMMGLGTPVAKYLFLHILFSHTQTALNTALGAALPSGEMAIGGWIREWDFFGFNISLRDCHPSLYYPPPPPSGRRRDQRERDDVLGRAAVVPQHAGVPAPALLCDAVHVCEIRIYDQDFE